MAEPPEVLHRKFQEAFNQCDLDAIVALYEPGAILVSGGGPARGADAIRELYRRVFAANPRIALETAQVDLAGDLAMLYGKWILHETGPDSAEFRREGRNIETARLQSDGRWLFVIDRSYGFDD